MVYVVTTDPTSWLAVVTVLLLTSRSLGVRGSGRDEEALIGWRGETYNGQTVQDVTQNAPRDDILWIETISWSPRAFIYHQFLTKEECDHLRDLAVKRLSCSMVVSETGDAIDPIRTSYSASIGPGEDRIVSAIEDKIAKWTKLPRSHGEPIEVLRYINGQKYDAHWDWFEDKEAGDIEGNRLATVLMYLSDVEQPGGGGETALPLAVPIDERLQSLESMSECAGRMGLSIRPRKGDALLFWDMKPDGVTVDRHSLHASCPTFKGEKWTATKWIHVRPYGSTGNDVS